VDVIEDFPASQQSAWQLVARESLALLAAGVLYPFGIGAQRRSTPRKPAQRTVVLVHGYLANRSTLLPLAGYLRWRGLRQVLAFDYPSSAGVERGAIALRDYLRRHVRGGRIDLVCHSLGGLVARVYLQQLGGARRVDRCITLGTPHRGTYNSYWVASRVGRELRPDSSLLARLEASRAQAERVRFLSIVAGSDNLVVPRVFAAHDEVVRVPEVGHVGMLFSHRVLHLVADRLLETDAGPAHSRPTSSTSACVPPFEA
jgi:pimeloyl-ACP methyl ester carboxylesterase